jgi:hypothetical protein
MQGHIMFWQICYNWVFNAKSKLQNMSVYYIVIKPE